MIGDGYSGRAAVDVATTAAITITTDLNPGDTIDGVTLVAGDRILVKDQGGGTDVANGIYVCAATPVRSDDLQTNDSANSIFVWVREGTTNANQGYICLEAPGSDVVDTDALTWQRFDLTGTLEVDRGGTGATSFSPTGSVIVAGASPTDPLVASGVVVDGSGNTTLPMGADLILTENGGTDTISIGAPSGMPTSYSLTMPVDDGLSGQVLTTDGSGVLTWETPTADMKLVSVIPQTVNVFSNTARLIGNFAWDGSAYGGFTTRECRYYHSGTGGVGAKQATIEVYDGAAVIGTDTIPISTAAGIRVFTFTPAPIGSDFRLEIRATCIPGTGSNVEIYGLQFCLS